MAKRTFVFVAVFAALLSVTLSVQAEDLDYYWAGSSNTNIFTAGNWRVGSLDGPTATVGLTTSGYNFDLYVDSTSQTITFDNSNFGSIRTLNIGTAAGTTTAAVQRTGGNNFIFANGKTLNIYKGGSFTFNNSGVEFQTSGDINLSGGTFTVQGASNFRLANASNSTLTISSGDLTINSKAYIGVGTYTATINQTGGNATFNNALYLGWGNGAVGQYNLTGGTVTTTAAAGLWTDNPQGISSFTVNGGTANFTQSGESFTVGLGGTNQLENVFTLTSGTVNVTDTFAVKYKGILNVNGGEFNAPTITVDSASTFNMTDGALKTRAIDMNGGTFTQGGGTLVYDGTLSVTGSAVLNGTIDMSRLVANPSQQVTVVTTTNGVSGSYNVTGSGWTPSSDANNITATFTGDTNAAYWNNGNAGSLAYDAGSNWIEYKDGQWKTVTTTYIFGNNNTQSDRICYILPYYDAETSTVKNVNINFNNTYTQVQSLTIGNGIGGTTGTVTVTRSGQMAVTTLLTINKGGSFTDNGQFSVSSGTLNVNGGEFTVNAGSNQVTNNGTITVSNEGSLSITSTNSFRIGDRGVGVLNINGGNLTVNSLTYLGVGTSSEAQSSGTINQTAGNTKFNNVLYLGWGDWSGTYNLSGGTLTTTNETGLWSGNSSGVSTFNMTGGTANFQKTGESFTVGLGGSQTLANKFNLYSGTVNATDTFAVKNSGALNVAKNGEDGGDGVLNANKIDIANNGELNLSSGTINLGAGGITNSEGSYNINLSGGTFGTNSASWSSALTAEIESGTVTFAPSSGNTITWSGALTGSGGVTKTGAGTLELSGHNTTGPEAYAYTGPTTISGGKLKYSNKYFLTSAVTIDEGGTLEFYNNYTGGALQYFSRLTALEGSGNLNFTGDNWTAFSIADTDGQTAQNFSGTVNLTDNAKIMIRDEDGNSKNLNLGNAKLNLGKNATVGLSGVSNTSASSLTVKELYTDTGSTIRVCSNNPGNNFGTLTVGSGTVNGNLGSTDDNYYSKVKLVKVSDGTEDNGTLTIKGTYLYTGSTKIEAGVLRLESAFTTSSALEGSGTLEIGAPSGSSSSWINVSINASDTTTPQSFTGTVNVTEGTQIMLKTGAGNVKDLNLGNATLHLEKNAVVGMHVKSGAISNLTVKELNTETGSTIRLCSENPGSNKFGTLTVGSGTVNGDLGTSANNYFKWVKLNKVSDGSETGGRLTLKGNFYYTGTTTVSAGVLELTGDAVVANGPISVGDDGTLEYNLANGQTKTLSITTANKIFSTGKVIKTGEGTLKLYALYSAAEKMIDVQSLVVSSGRVDIKEFFYGQLIVQGEGTFSPGNSVGTLEIGDGTYGGGFILNEAGAELLMEIAGSSAAENDFLLVDGDITLEDGSIITLVNNSNLGLGESFTAILSAENSSTLDVLSHIQTTDFTDLKYEPVTYGDKTLYAITGRTLNANEIPEPSTWALLILGVAGLLYWRKRKNNK